MAWWLRRLAGHLLDLDAALRAGHEHDALRAAIDHRPEIEFGRDVAGFLDEHAPYRLAAFVRLVGDQIPAEHPPGGFGRGVGIVDQLDPAGLATAARVDLRLDDPFLAGEFPHGVGRFGFVVDDDAVGHRDVVLAKQLFRLIFVQIHCGYSLRVIRLPADSLLRADRCNSVHAESRRPTRLRVPCPHSGQPPLQGQVRAVSEAVRGQARFCSYRPLCMLRASA